jgi:putative nucleotidyltransferase with HDIG domain
MVSKRGAHSLEAILGSCVGVALVDRKNGLGGLLHTLLPEPMAADHLDHPGRYAETGVPALLNEMLKQGAELENLECTLGGGALVGPVSQSDMDFDIGGRTLEVAESLLKENGVNIIGQETGGYFSCRLVLRLSDLSCHIEPVQDLDRLGAQDRQPPSYENLRERLTRLRPIPQIALKVLRMISKEEYDITDVANYVKQDQVISGKLLALCNSAMFNLREKIDTIERAIAFLGNKYFLTLVVSASMETFFADQPRGYSLCKGGIYQHAIGTAKTAAQLAKHTGLAQPELAYTAGLLHDIGKVSLDQFVAGSNPFFYRQTQVIGRSLLSVEEKTFGINHALAGGMLADAWGLSNNLRDPIVFHHQPEKSEFNPELTSIVYFADLLMSRFRTGQELERMDEGNLFERAKKIGIHDQEFAAIVDLIPQDVFEGLNLGGV